MSAIGTFTEDVHAARCGDSMAWARLVRRFTPQIRAVARRRGLAAHDQDEVVQRTWLALVKGIHSVQQPLALPGWIQTTAHRESLRVRNEAAREVPSAEVAVTEPVWDADLEDVCDARERHAKVRQAVERIPARQRELLQALVAEPALSYDEISRKLDMPVGSIGPTRARSLARLRRDPYLAGLVDEVPPRRTTRPAPAAPDMLSQ
jgi:RNA polymerase sigma factor (sigma-70 family)